MPIILSTIKYNFNANDYDKRYYHDRHYMCLIHHLLFLVNAHLIAMTTCVSISLIRLRSFETSISSRKEICCH